MAWQSYGPIDPSTIVKTAAKKHYYRSHIEYSFDVRIVTSDSGEFYVGHYLTDGQVTSTQTINKARTLTGNTSISALQYALYIYATDRSHTSGYLWPVYWYDASATNYIRAYTPTLSFGYGEKAVPVPTASYTGGFIDWTKSQTITFGTDLIDNIDEQYTVASGTFYYKQSSAGSYTSKSFTGDSVTLAANTFSSGKTYDAYADLVLDDGTTCTYQFSQISTTDSTGTCSIISPNNEVLYGDITFRWNYSNPSGTAQKSYDLQISADGSTWTTIKSQIVSAETIATYVQSTSGATYWRVRGYNQNNVAGEWSSPGYYINNIPPDAPTITSVSGSGRQTVAWSASSQNAYQVQVVNSSGEIVFDSGEVYSTVMTCLVNEYLPNDVYAFKVRIATSIGGWSEWASMSKTISAPLSAPSFTLSSSDECVIITVADSNTYDFYYVLRNGVLIGKTTTFINDYFVAGSAEYEVIGVKSSDDKYGYSFQSITFHPAHNQIVTEGGEVILVNRRLNERAFPQKSISPKYAAYDYLGEDRPSHVFVDGFRKGSFTVAMYDKSGTAEDLLGEPVFFNTTAGWGDWCVVTAINRREMLFGNETTITLDLTSNPERIEYDI